eukprot:759183_1
MAAPSSLEMQPILDEMEKEERDVFHEFTKEGTAMHTHTKVEEDRETKLADFRRNHASSTSEQIRQAATDAKIEAYSKRHAKSEGWYEECQLADLYVKEAAERDTNWIWDDSSPGFVEFRGTPEEKRQAAQDLMSDSSSPLAILFMRHALVADSSYIWYPDEKRFVKFDSAVARDKRKYALSFMKFVKSMDASEKKITKPLATYFTARAVSKCYAYNDGKTAYVEICTPRLVGEGGRSDIHFTRTERRGRTEPVTAATGVGHL